MCIRDRFPIGLLLLLVKPTWHCKGCRYSFQSYAEPVDEVADRKPHGVAYGIVFGLLVLVAVVGGLFVMLLAAR